MLRYVLDTVYTFSRIAKSWFQEPDCTLHENEMLDFMTSVLLKCVLETQGG